MNILTVENKIINLCNIDEFTDIPRTQFTIIDLGSDAIKEEEAPDIRFPKLVYIEEYTGPAIKCSIGGHIVIIPLSWYIFIGEEDFGDVEIVPVTSINARNFSTVVSDPIRGFRHHFMDIRPVDLYMEYEWVLPKVKNGQAVAVPINDDPDRPLCIYLSPSKSKIPETVNAGDFV